WAFSRLVRAVDIRFSCAKTCDAPLPRDALCDCPTLSDIHDGRRCGKAAMRKIALEEHFWTEGFPHTGKLGADLFQPAFLRVIDERFAEFAELRLAAMDEAGIEISVLSLISPGVQTERDRAKAVSEAQRANDFLSSAIAKHPTRYAGFAHLPMQEPLAAAAEL